MNAQVRALVATVALALAAFGSAAAGLEEPVLRGALGLLAVLVLPGYAWSHWLPRGETTAPEVLLRVVGLSLVTSVIVGTVLALTPIGVDATSAAAGLAAVTIVVAGAALARHREPVRLGVRPTLAGALCAAVLLGSGATALAISGEDPPPLERFTGLSMSGTSTGATLAVESHDTRVRSFELRVSAAGSRLATYDLTLKPGARWTKPLRMTGMDAKRVVAELVAPDGTVARSVAWEPAR